MFERDWLKIVIAGSRADTVGAEGIEGQLSAMTVSLTSHQYKSYNVILLQRIASNIPVQLGKKTPHSIVLCYRSQHVLRHGLFNYRSSLCFVSFLARHNDID